MASLDIAREPQIWVYLNYQIAQILSAHFHYGYFKYFSSEEQLVNEFIVSGTPNDLIVVNSVPRELEMHPKMEIVHESSAKEIANLILTKYRDFSIRKNQTA